MPPDLSLIAFGRKRDVRFRVRLVPGQVAQEGYVIQIRVLGGRHVSFGSSLRAPEYVVNGRVRVQRRFT